MINIVKSLLTTDTGKSDLNMHGHIFTFGEGTDWTKKPDAEVGGARDKGPEGGTYINGNEKALIKKDVNEVTPKGEINEYIGSEMMQMVFKGFGAVVFPMVPQSKLDTFTPRDLEGDDVYVRSLYDSRIRTDGIVHLSDAMFGKGEKRRKLAGTRDAVNMALRVQGMKKMVLPLLGYEVSEKTYSTFFSGTGKLYKGWPEIAMGSLFIGDWDLHSENIVLLDIDSKVTMARIDFGCAFYRLTPSIKPFEYINPVAGFQKVVIPKLVPTNHFNEFPDFMMRTQEFA
jgi:hypothetical protein